MARTDTVEIAVERVDPRAKLPVYAHPEDAGADIFALENTTIRPQETATIRTGLRFAVPLGFELQIRPRSGLSLRTKLRVANSPGTIDCGYAGEVLIIVDNIGTEAITVQEGQRLCQMVVQRVPHAVFYAVPDITPHLIADRQGGFGSTDQGDCGSSGPGKTS